MNWTISLGISPQKHLSRKAKVKMLLLIVLIKENEMKKIMVTGWLILLLLIVGSLFWYNEWRYHLPTPIPQNYKVVNIGQIISIALPVKDKKQPMFLHFFNPGCPCSRFNMTNFKQLYRQYNKQLNFIIVVMSSRTYTVQEIQDKFDLPVPVLFNPAIARACGVYSTPQVALLDAGNKLYYRGNYNRSRYCTDEKTNYAKTAIVSLLNSYPLLVSDPLALKAYGCSLPNCIK